MIQAWIMSVDAAEAFFELCLMREAVTEPERLAILQELVMAGRAHWFKSNASKEEIIKALAGDYNVHTVRRNNGRR